MAKIQPKLEIAVNPLQPVQEICEVITAVCAYHPGNEIKVLEGIQDAIGKRLSEIEVKKDQSAE